MTLCIAAACQDKRKGRLVIATDWKATIGSATAENQDKLFWATGCIPVMIAGNISRAIELKDSYRSYFAKLADKKKLEINPNHIVDVLRRPVAIQKRKLANEHISLKFGMTYKEFCQAVGKNEIPSVVATETLNEIARIDLQCSLIIAMFSRKEPHIYKVDEYGVVSTCDNFAAIGSGSPIAEGALYQREQEDNMPLGVTIYHVFEAMKLGSIASDVGKEHTLNILYPPAKNGENVEIKEISDSGKAFLERKFKKLGPKDFSQMKLPPNFLE